MKDLIKQVEELTSQIKSDHLEIINYFKTIDKMIAKTKKDFSKIKKHKVD